jgi:flagella basal body P-ring formation protein FlgA
MQHKSKSYRLALVLAALCSATALSFEMVGASIAVADSQTSRRTEIRLQGRSETVVTEPVVHLSDVALIESAAVSDDEAIVELRRIPLVNSPKAGESLTIEGVSIIEKLRDAGVRLDSLLYTFPKQVRVTRAYREVSYEELERALRSFILAEDRKIDVKHLVAEKQVRIPADALSIEVVGLQAIQPGHFGVDYRSRAASGEVRFQMKALADEWRMMPAAAKPIKRGDVITASDVRLVKVNGTSVASDSLEQIGDVVGRVLLRDIGQGEIFSLKAVKIPPVIEVGSRVTMIYKRGRLEATARGVALEDGAQGQEIGIRNESSKKVVRGRVHEKGVVTVGAY